MSITSNYARTGSQQYGDIDNVKRDAGIIREILSRQGSDLLLEVIANGVGDCRVKFNLSEVEINRVKASLIDSLSELINERV